MRKRAERDVLTGLFNRGEFESRINNYFYNNDDPRGVFIIIDIDNFKTVNDTYGHVVGDNVISYVAQRFSTIFAETSIVGRIGGDELTLFIPFKMSLDLLVKKLNEFCLSTSFRDDDFNISCSAGVCLCPEYGKTYSELYRNADMALLASKRNGKSQFSFYDESTNVVTPNIIQEKTLAMLDNVSEAMFVSDAITSKIVYINETACNIINKSKEECLEKRCYELFWERCQRCDRCQSIDLYNNEFYEENTFLKDQATLVHIKARIEKWDDREVKVHFLSIF
ncbi:MAG: diguanylate cyclase [Erysipelotrichaceae bacterium]